MPEPTKCPQCGTPLKGNALAGLCPACLLGEGVTDEGVTGGAPSNFTPPDPSELAPLFPQFEILDLIGKGGMGAVYKARQKQLDRIVALKILPPGIGNDPAFAERFTREAKALARLNHPGIVTIHDFGVASQTADSPKLYYFLMEFVDGVTLRQLLNGGRVSAREALAIVPQICDALQFAHDHGIVHRDIKPENILLDRRGRVKVADFGLAKLMGGDIPFGVPPSGGSEDRLKPELQTPGLTDAGKVMGTPNYMAPEQLERPTEVDHRADIYALGVVFYQMLTGELPGKTIAAPSTKVQIDVRLDEIVLRALEKNPERRYDQASVLKTQVEKVSNPGRSRREEAPTEKLHPASTSADTNTFPLSLKIVAALFFLGGCSATWDVVSNIPNHIYSFNLGVIGIPIGIGLLRQRRWWWKTARLYLGVALCLLAVAIVFSAAGGFHISPGASVRFFGKELTGPARPFAAIGAIIVFTALLIWMLRVLMRPKTKTFFQKKGFDRPWIEWGALVGVLLVMIIPVLLRGGPTFTPPNAPSLTAVRLFLPMHEISFIAAAVFVLLVIPLWVWSNRHIFSPSKNPPQLKEEGIPAANNERLSPGQRKVLTFGNVAVAAFLLLLGWAAYHLGIFFNTLFLFIVLMLPVQIGLTFWRAFLGRMEQRLWRAPRSPGLGLHWLQLGNRWLFWLLAAVVLKLCLVPAQFSDQEYFIIRAVVWGGVATLMLLALFPGKRIYAGTNLLFAIGSLFMAFQVGKILWPASPANAVVLTAPFQGEWLVVHGGNSQLINSHYTVQSQRHSLDMEKLVDGKERTGLRSKLESYPSWGETLYAPANGTIVKVVNDLEDHPIGQSEAHHAAGNYIALDIGAARYVVMAHLQKGSVRVKPGETVDVGQAIAKVGNSGNTSHPHLHLQVQNKPDFYSPGTKTFPIAFNNATLVRSQRPQNKTEFIVRRNDLVVRTNAGNSHLVPRTVRQVNGAPYIAHLPKEGSIELLAIRTHPSTNKTWWQPNGFPSVYDSSISFEGEETIRQGVLAIARVNYPEMDNATNANVSLATGRRFALEEGQRVALENYGIMVFEQVLPQGAQITTLSAKVAAAPWEILNRQKPGTLARWLTGPSGKDWTFSETPSGNLVVTLKRVLMDSEREYQLVAVDLDGIEHAPSTTSKKTTSTSIWAEYEASFDAVGSKANRGPLPLSRIKEVRWESRPYEYVQFRNVSLRPGNLTRVEIKDFSTNSAVTQKQTEKSSWSHPLSKNDFREYPVNKRWRELFTATPRTPEEAQATAVRKMLEEDPATVLNNYSWDAPRLLPGSLNVTISDTDRAKTYDSLTLKVILYRETIAAIIAKQRNPADEEIIVTAVVAQHDGVWKNILETGLPDGTTAHEAEKAFRTKAPELFATFENLPKQRPDPAQELATSAGEVTAALFDTVRQLLETTATQTVVQIPQLIQTTEQISMSVKAAAHSPKAVAPALGPEVKRFIPVEGEVSPGMHILNFRTGNIVTPTNDFGATAEEFNPAVEKLNEWMKANAGAVAEINTEGEMRLFGFSWCKFAPVERELWDDEDTAVLARFEKARFRADTSDTKTGGGTYLFKTDDGTRGILRITSLSDSPRGMWISYKLVEPPAK